MRRHAGRAGTKLEPYRRWREENLCEPLQGPSRGHEGLVELLAKLVSFGVVTKDFDLHFAFRPHPQPWYERLHLLQG